MKVLVLDDEESLRTLLCDNLSFEGIDTIQASTGIEAIGLATSQSPDLAVLDIGLPDMSGWKVCERLRKDEQTKHLPLIVLSGSVGSEIDALAKSYGVGHWVSKPYEPSVLVELIKSVLNGRKNP